MRQHQQTGLVVPVPHGNLQPPIAITSAVPTHNFTPSSPSRNQQIPQTWNTNGNAGNTFATVTSLTIPEEDDVEGVLSPPVAPAVVMDGSDNRASSGSYSYPVASFVTSVVRSGMDQIQCATQAFETPPIPRETVPLIVRTESESIEHDRQREVAQARFHGDLAMAAQAEYRGDLAMAVGSVRVFPEQSRTNVLDNAVSQNPEVVLVDGNLIAIPHQSPLQTQQLDIENKIKQQGMANNNSIVKSCEPKKVKKGLRRIFGGIFGGKSKSKEKQSANVLPEIETSRTNDSHSQDANEHLKPQQIVIQQPDGPSEVDRWRNQQKLLEQATEKYQNNINVKEHPSDDVSKQQKGKHNAKRNNNKNTKDSDHEKKHRKPLLWAGRRHKHDDDSPPNTVATSDVGNLKAPPDTLLSQNEAKPPPNNMKPPPTASVLPDSNLPESRRSSLEERNLETEVTLDTMNAFAQMNATESNMIETSRSIINTYDVTCLRVVDDNIDADASVLFGFAPTPHPVIMDSRTASVTATYVGAEHIYDYYAPTSITAASFLAYDDYHDASRKKEEDDFTNFSYIEPVRAIDCRDDIKVDKEDAPDVDYMLRRAGFEASNDLGTLQEHDDDDNDYLPPELAATLPSIPMPSSLSTSYPCALKSDFTSVPLSEAGVSDDVVHNDMLKVVMVSAPSVNKSWLARALRRSHKRPKNRATLAVEIHEWKLPADKMASKLKQMNEESGEFGIGSTPVKCMIWDVQGATSKLDDSKANFGVHPATQSLFFSPQSLYLLVWDLGYGNRNTYLRQLVPTRATADDDDDSDFDDDDADEMAREEANRMADRALHADIMNRVLSWVDCIAEKGPMSTILPVALIPSGMTDVEIKRRCEMLKNMLTHHIENFPENVVMPNVLTTENDDIICVEYKDGAPSKEVCPGIEQLEDLVIAIAADPSHSVFTHVGTHVPPGTILVWDCIKRFKNEHKLILLDHLLCEVGSMLEMEVVVGALEFLSSIGQIMYFGNSQEVLSRFIILCTKWFVSALSCILRNDFKNEIVETRRFMNMQTFYDNVAYQEHELIKVLATHTESNLPLISDTDANMLWQNWNFMREAQDQYSQFEENSTSTPTMFYFLERLLVHSGVFIPVSTPPSGGLDENPQKVFFVPSLLVQANPTDLWTYKSGESWITTLCHSWLFRDGAGPHLMENLVVNLLRDLYEFAKEFHTSANEEPMERAWTSPLGRRAINDFVDTHSEEKIGRVRLHQVMCWKSCMVLKIGTIFPDQENGELRESMVEIFVAVCDQSSGHCISANEMRPNMHRVIVSGKGNVGHHGRRLWKGGYRVVLDSLRSSLAQYEHVDPQIICPECLRQPNPRIAKTFAWNAEAEKKNTGSSVNCPFGHKVDKNLIYGTNIDQVKVIDSISILQTGKKVHQMLPSVVIVGVYDPASNRLVSVGSGFIADKKLGFVVTAAHVVFTFEAGESFGAPYHGVAGARVVIGMHSKEKNRAVFRYWADIVAHDVQHVDACVVRILSRMENDVDDEGEGCGSQSEIPLSPETLPNEQLPSMKLTKQFEIEENVRVLGYNQGGEGIFQKGTHVNRTADFAKGYICRVFKEPMQDDSSTSSSEASYHASFTPQEEIIIMCHTISGHSGGPCVNNDGRVIGVVSRADPVENRRCHLVPAAEVKTLIMKAKNVCSQSPSHHHLLKSI